MDIVTVRRRFEAYSSGTASGAELRMAVVDAVRADRRLAKSCTALVGRCFESDDADQELRASILADITSLTIAPPAANAAAAPAVTSIRRGRRLTCRPRSASLRPRSSC